MAAVVMSLRLRPPPPTPNARPIPSNPRLLPPRTLIRSPPFCSPLSLGFALRRPLGFGVRASANLDGDGKETAPADEWRGQSTMPDRFRHLTQEVPDRPVRWPWFVALAFLLYAWRTVFWELSNWKKATLAIFHFFGYLFKLALAFVFHYIGGPITGIIRCIEIILFYARSTYFNVVAFAPVPELTRIILFTSTVLAIAEATVPDSVESQPYLLTFSGLVGFGAVSGFIPELLVLLLLIGMFCYSRFIKKKDSASAALPSVAVLAAVGEPWVRFLVMGSYLALAIVQHSRSSKESVRTEVSVSGRKLPLPLQLAALAIGINLAAKWIRHRHLTWMIV